MQNLKISVVTVVYNAQNTIEKCLDSVARQKFNNIEHIVIDGGSTDDTVHIIKKYSNNIQVFVSEPDEGIYDAMNKGIRLATGDIIGTLNADDYLANDEVLIDIAAAFASQETDVLYGDLDFIEPDGNIVRKWRSGGYKYGKFNWGWMPPHPTFYCKRTLFERLGGYRLDYGSAADYELMLRFLHANKMSVFYLQKVIVKMYVGGVSNKNLINRVKALRFDLKAMRNNDILFPFITVVYKPLRKILQFF
ncbi:glycosyltransferase family 2 protein [Mucilaginibacter sp.]|jgi:glycosyltransferase involved in cell wall biosynthesis|uniref:glycosyltransferase family 2 protein n=1 Tax=Mucilaginibacter sp. TaxID=1882438 RepID=UPI002C943488|nr:glycosyltransferase family 2 protein [Mucilaginibacter sp.]HTI60968.1 glycosyltransferase family 2 protein [Mucilaginibacter sp.]